MLPLLVALAEPCPAIAIKPQAMPHVSQPGFLAWLDPWPEDARLRFHWTVTQGDILPGFANLDTEVRLDLDELMRHDVDFELTVDVEGLPEGCPHTATGHFAEPRYAGPPLQRGEDGGLCPTIEVNWYASEHLTGEYFVARIDPMPKTPVSYNWSATGARLVPGEEPRFASVETDLRELTQHDVSFEITLDVGGLPKGCPHTSSRKNRVPRFDGFDRLPPKPN